MEVQSLEVSTQKILPRGTLPRRVGLAPGYTQNCSMGCDSCYLKFLCFTTRGEIILSYNYLKEYQRDKAKRQGHLK